MNKKAGSMLFRVGMILSLVMILLVGSVGSVSAAGYDDDGIIEADEVINDDIVLSADKVVVDGTVNGILVAFGETVTINGTVNGDVFAFGNQIIVNQGAFIDGNLFSGAALIEVAGEISGSLAGGSSSAVLKNGASIGRNLYYGGYSLEVEPEAEVGIDLFSGNYQIQMDGTVGRDLNIGGAAIDLNGKVGRDVTIEMGNAVENSDVNVYYPMPYMYPGYPGSVTNHEIGLRVSPEAEIGGDLIYTSTVALDKEIQSEPTGDVIFRTPVPSEEEYSYTHDTSPARVTDFVFGRFVSGILGKFWKNLTALLILGALVVAFLPKLFKNTVSQLRRKPLPSAGYGILTVMGGYVAVFVLFFVVLLVSLFFTAFTLGGLSTATFGIGLTGLVMLFLVFQLLIFFGSKLVVSYLVGDWILSKLSPNSENVRKPFWGLALGVLLYALLRCIPFVGGFVAFLAIIFGTGAMLLLFIDWRSEKQPEAITVVSE